MRFVTTTISKGIKTIQLDFKPVNALTGPLLSQLKEELETTKHDKDVKGVLFGSGLEKVFSAGLDLKTLVADEEFHLPGDGSSATPVQMELYKSHIRTYMGLFSDCVQEFLTLPQPTVALVKGHAPAGGTVLALCADVRIASSSGFAMGLNEVQVGMAPPLWVHQLMRNTIGARKGAIAMQTGKIYNMKECIDLGLVDKVVPVEELQAAGITEIESYLKLPWVARVDAKLKSNLSITSEFTEDALEGVVQSISGPEFQSTVKGILESLSKKKK